MDCRKQMYAQMGSLHLYRFPKEGRSLVACELESYLKVLEPMMEQIQALKKEVLAARCSEEQLTKFERMLAIPVHKEMELDKRRAIVQSKMSIGPSDFNRDGLERSLAATARRLEAMILALEENRRHPGLEIPPHYQPKPEL